MHFASVDTVHVAVVTQTERNSDIYSASIASLSRKSQLLTVSRRLQFLNAACQVSTLPQMPQAVASLLHLIQSHMRLRSWTSRTPSITGQQLSVTTQ